MRNTPWTERWTVIRELSPGGACCTYLVRRAGTKDKDAAKDKSQQFVLKTLRNAHSPEHRARMHHQVAALRTLNHPGIAKFVESNADRFDGPEDLYVVTEYAPGRDLESLAGLSPLAVPQACAIVGRVLEALKYAHGRDVIHRDLKPSHVVLREGREDEPVLLDFGLSFNRDPLPLPEADGKAQRNGRLFVHLPEDHSRGADRKTDVSDLTQCVALLFYLLTSERPGVLTDDRGRKPHERERADRLLGQLDGPYQEQLRRIFDVGFADESGRRWQSAESLAAEIERLKTPTAPVPEDRVTGRARGIRRKLGENPEMTRQQSADKLATDVVAAVSNTLNVLNAELEDVLKIGLVLSRPRPGFKKVAMNFIFSHRLNPKHKLECGVSTSLENQDLVLVAECLGRTGEVVRVGLQDPEAPQLLRNAVETFLLDTAEHFASTAV